MILITRPGLTRPTGHTGQKRPTSLFLITRHNQDFYKKPNTHDENFLRPVCPVCHVGPGPAGARTILLFTSIFLFCFSLYAGLYAEEDFKVDPKTLLQGGFAEGITVDLRAPSYCEGVLQTTEGGVITGPSIRIQARHIVYTRKVVESSPVCTIMAEGDLMLEFNDYIFLGERLDYDFQSRTGVLYRATSRLSPWYIGGQIIQLCADGSFIATDAFITLSDNACPDWYISAETVSLREYRFLEASPVRFRLMNNTLFWLPSLSLDLKTITESPVKYSGGWGGHQGPRVGMSYEVFSSERSKIFLRLDYRLNRGPGIGLETHYRSEDCRHYLDSINYFARDSAIFHPQERYRYRFQGLYHNQLCNDRVTIDGVYDKLSDKYMAIDYADQSLDIPLASRTQLDIRRQEETWISILTSRLRVNSFETVKQELPTVYLNLKPFELGNTGIIDDTRGEAAFLDFSYANNVTHVHDYSSTRLALYQNFYRPSYLGPFTVTPDLGGTAIFYGNGPHGGGRWAALGQFGGVINTSLHRIYGPFKHVVVPYADYHYYTFPTTNPDDHFIFDINDGWYRLNMLTFGTAQSWYAKDREGCLRRWLFADVHANAFFDTKTIPQCIPKAYAEIVYRPSLRLTYILDTAWDFTIQQFDHFNLRALWTAGPDFAVSAEYRHRSPRDWRKADKDNFILESFRSVRELLDSSLSDRRDIGLLHFFYRFHPKWAIECETRQGWNRKNHTRFIEYEVDLMTTLLSSAQIRLSYQHRESEDRVAVYFSVWPQGPETWRKGDCISKVEF